MTRPRVRCLSSEVTRKELKKKWDAVIVGGGHNGLTAAAYLARSGLSVAVLERRHVIGGAAVTEEIIPGFKFSRCSYLQSLLRPSVLRELELKRHGLKLFKPIATVFTPCIDGRYLLLWPDDHRNYEEISKFSKRDAEAYQRYEDQLQKFSKTLHFLWDSTPPEILAGSSSFTEWLKDKLNKSLFWARFLRHAFSLGQKDMVEFVDLILSPTSKVLDYWFEASINAPGSGYELLHHVMGQSDDHPNVWLHVEGGMGSISLAISNAAKEAGAYILTNAEVSHVMINDNGRVSGVLLADGTQIQSSIVLSNATPYKTFTDLVPQGVLPNDFLHQILQSDYSTYTPYSPSDGSWEDPAYREAFAQKCYGLIDEYAPGFRSSVIGYDMLTPPDLERVFGLTGGNIFHGAMTLNQIFLLRPIKGCFRGAYRSGYRTPVKGLYLCGSGTHPGGGVTGGPGRNAAFTVLRDINKKTRG
ncbi:hypothetical protein Cgig2_019670 [Carnegiea gigantea]|uniref:Amine oxidase domain-containing protein n=1 Tax=Carnegiea gigantea TaxID=171969 RepID=A0A9Q1KIY9_9CARY|nr:hypothetical protein Cgig2_019670 [Carnegiea gigantea]